MTITVREADVAIPNEGFETTLSYAECSECDWRSLNWTSGGKASEDGDLHNLESHGIESEYRTWFRRESPDYDGSAEEDLDAEETAVETSELLRELRHDLLGGIIPDQGRLLQMARAENDDEAAGVHVAAIEKYRLQSRELLTARFALRHAIPGPDDFHWLEMDDDERQAFLASTLEAPSIDAEYEQYIAEASSTGEYIDVGALLDGNLVTPAPTIGHRVDGEPFLYGSAVNVIFGDPESGKTLIAAAVAADTLFAGDSVLWVDLDHNGAPATIGRLRSFGVPAETLRDPSRFRLAMPEDAESLAAVVEDARLWRPSVAIIDSVAEMLGLHGASNDSSDDFTRVNRVTLAALARHGAGVIAIDHVAKGQASRDYGAGGTVAKKRAVDGVMLRATVLATFRPGYGGKVRLTVVKDRHGGVRAITPAGDKEPAVATFELIERGQSKDWKFREAAGSKREAQEVARSDLQVLFDLDPVPTSMNDIKRRLGWGSTRATTAFNLFKEQI